MESIEELAARRYVPAASAGGRNGYRFAVIDRHDSQGGKGMRRVSWHRTYAAARTEAKRLNRNERN